ncbi:TonB-dependent siderophore receptor [Zestomonas carbonaria]|uniref:Metal-pseudopaline receptor CntO n=1 Tax=Zestomonas carbonaria TaxID=2762745 RepID=A0A7U7EP18_9GAMM|nr:TonB-dependent siderophore receptor [Pseudomonas carbonaria]CAD5108569.1 Metal-pseudopaline receptor CntO [Pseudomonas carbonaria]
MPHQIPSRFALSITALLVTLYAQAEPDQPSDGEEGQITLDATQVVGRAQTLYKVSEATTGTRTPTPLEKVPQAIQVLPRELIDDQAARQVTDLYRNISGVTQFSYAGVTMRGFRQENVLYDGMRGDPYAGFAVPLLFNIDRLEVLKGPAGVMYGGGDPGGVINYVTKKPQHQALNRLQVQGGNYDYRSGSFESTGPLPGNERLRYRVGIFTEGENPFRDNTDAENNVADFGLAMDIGETGELTLQYTEIKQKLNGNRLRGVPVNDKGSFLTDREWNHNEGTDFLDLDARIALARYQFAPSDMVDLDFTARWFENTERQQYHEPMGLVDRDGDGTGEWMTRQFRDQKRENDGLNLNGNSIWRFDTVGFAHTLLFGADWFQLDGNLRQRTAASDLRPDGRPNPGGTVPGLDLFDPAYGQSSRSDYDLDSLPWAFSETRGTRYGGYLQDQIDLTERWSLLLGLRWDEFKDENRISDSSVRGDDLTWRLGTTYELARGVNAYATLATGFNPQASGNQDERFGGPFDPEESKLWEVGLKTELVDGRVNLNTAIYRIERRNILQQTGEVVNGFNQLSPLGLVRSQGVEVDLLADLTERWVLNLSYAYNDAEVRDAGPNGITNSVGKRFANAPRNQLGLWTRYDLPQWNSAVSFGSEYVDERVSLDGQTVKPYTIFDASWQTTIQNWKFQANVKNLFDRKYAASGFIERNGHFPGEPRRFYVQATYDF